MSKLFRIPLSALVLLVSTTAVAQDIKKDMLARDHEKCVLGCLANNEGEICEVLCDCTIEHFSQLDQGDYVRLQIELNSGRISPDNRELLDATAQACAAEVERKFPLYE